MECNICSENVFETDDGIFICSNGHQLNENAFATTYNRDSQLTTKSARMIKTTTKQIKKIKSVRNYVLAENILTRNTIGLIKIYWTFIREDYNNIILKTKDDTIDFAKKNKLNFEKIDDRYYIDNDNEFYLKHLNYDEIDIFKSFIFYIHSNKLSLLKFRKIFLTAFYYYKKTIYEYSYINIAKKYNNRKDYPSNIITNLTNDLNKAELEQINKILKKYQTDDFLVFSVDDFNSNKNKILDRYNDMIKRPFKEVKLSKNPLKTNTINFNLHIYETHNILKTIDDSFGINLNQDLILVLKYFDYISYKFKFFEDAFNVNDNRKGKILGSNPYITMKMNLVIFYEQYIRKRRIYVYEMFIIMYILTYTLNIPVILNLNGFYKYLKEAKGKTESKLYVELMHDNRILPQLIYNKTFKSLIISYCGFSPHEFNKEKNIYEKIFKKCIKKLKHLK